VLCARLQVGVVLVLAVVGQFAALVKDALLRSGEACGFWKPSACQSGRLEKGFGVVEVLKSSDLSCVMHLVGVPGVWACKAGDSLHKPLEMLGVFVSCCSVDAGRGLELVVGGVLAGLPPVREVGVPGSMTCGKWKKG
jgi:hypothetical protein